MAIVLVLIVLLIGVGTAFLWRMLRQDDGVHGILGLSALFAAAILGAVYGVLDTA